MELKEKLEKVLTKILYPDFHLQNDDYFNLLTDHLKKKDNEGLISQEVAVDFLKKFSKSPGKLLTVSAFVLNFAALQTSCEETFVKLNGENVFERLFESACKLCAEQSNAGLNVKLGYVRLVTSFLKHKSGKQWVLSTCYWQKVLEATLRCESVYLQKEGCYFMALMLHGAANVNEPFTINVLQIVLNPLITVLRQHKEIREQTVYQTLCPNLNLISKILENLLELSTANDDYKVFLMLRDRFMLEKIIGGILSKVKNEDFVFELNKVLFIFSFFELVHKAGGRPGSLNIEDGIRTAQKVFDVFLDSANRGTVSNLLKLCYVGHIYWSQISKKMPVCLSQDSMPLFFEDQLLMLQLYPSVIVSFKLLGNILEDDSEDDVFREGLVNELCRNVIHPTFRTVFKWRSYLLKNFSFDHAILALKYVLHSRRFYTKERANMAFRILLYSLKDIAKIMMEKPDQVLRLSRESNYVYLLMEAITVLINEFDLTWKDNIETICVMDITFNFLSFPVWPTRLVVKGLKLLEIAVSKDMSPSQALLIDSMNDSTLSLMAPMLYAKLHDSNWEVKDSALEVVKSISHNSCKKFTSFRKVIIDGDFPTITLKMCINDDNEFVRAAALKCLKEMVEVDQFWSKLVENDIYNEIRGILLKETEGVVRCEAASLVNAIYQHRNLPESFYDIMTHAALDDFHWEVKTNALYFWLSVIDRHLTQQGMIDGSFPSITFSNCKMVTLNNKEIKKRLLTILKDLSTTGCLGVFTTSLKEDCDYKVRKVAYSLLSNFISLLKQYEINAPMEIDSSSPTSLLFSPISLPLSSPVQTNANNDEIIEEILNCPDLNYLEERLKEMPVDAPVKDPERRVVSPDDFLRIIFGNIPEKLIETDQWIKNMSCLDSLLDDILSEYVVDLSLDCY